MTAPLLCPECAQGKTVNCAGQALDPATDELVSCATTKPFDVTAERDDLLSRLGCVVEATYWDRPYDERIAAIRGMCDLTTNGMTPDGTDWKAKAERLDRWKQEALPVIFGLQDLGRALDMRVGTSITGPAAAEAAKDLRARAESAEAGLAALLSGVRTWCAINEIAEPPLDWAGLGEFLDRAAPANPSAAGGA